MILSDFLVIFFAVFMPLLFAFYGFFAIIGDIKAAPFVPTSQNYLESIFSKVNFKENQRFLELGSGDGRVTNFVVKKFGVAGLGIEYNPTLVLFARLMARLKGVKAQFKRGDLYHQDLSGFRVIFLFLMPKATKKLSAKFQKECSQDTLIISHGFTIPGLEEKLIDQIDRKLFSTYYYRI